MSISLIAAMDLNRNIGLNGDMPWGKTMPADLQYFKDTTSNKMIIMGRKTFESLPGILPYRSHIVLSRGDYEVDSPFVSVSDSIEDILKLVEFEGKEAFVIGGAQIYEQFLPYANKIYLTKIITSLDGDTKFPDIVGSWEIDQQPMFHHDKDKYASQRIIYTRRQV